eukprot:6917567-Alexandrium_andersonii.AAC.1
MRPVPPRNLVVQLQFACKPRSAQLGQQQMQAGCRLGHALLAVAMRPCLTRTRALYSKRNSAIARAAVAVGRWWLACPN